MASWLALFFLVLLSANTVLPADDENTYKDKLIDEDPYLSKCFVSTGTGDLKQVGVKKIHSGSECYAKTKIKFEVEDYGNAFYVFYEQGENHVLPARIRYKFGECSDLKLEIKKENDKIVYTLHRPDGSAGVLDPGFVFRIERRNEGRDQDPDIMQVYHNSMMVFHFSEKCNAFQRDSKATKYPTLMDFEQEVEEGVPDFTLLWNTPPSPRFFGVATAREILEVVTTTSTTTTTAEPTTSGTSSKPSTTSSLVSSTATNTTVVPSPALVVEEKEETFPWWIIAVVGVLLLLLLVGLVVGYLCWRRRSAQKPKPVAPQTETTVGTETTVQEKSQYGPNMMYFARDAKPTDPAAAPK